MVQLAQFQEDPETIRIKLQSTTLGCLLIYRTGQPGTLEEYEQYLKKALPGAIPGTWYDASYFPSSVLYSSVKSSRKGNYWYLAMHKRSDLWTVLENTITQRHLEEAENVIITSDNALSNNTILDVLARCPKCVNADVTITNSHAAGSEQLQASLLLQNLHSLLLSYDEHSRKVLAKDVPWYEAIRGQKIQRLVLENVPLTTASMQSFLTPELKTLFVSNSKEDDFRRLTKCLASAHAYPKIVLVINSRIPLDFSAEPFAKMSELTVESISLQDTVRILHACPKSMFRVIVRSPVVDAKVWLPWHTRWRVSQFLQTFVANCPEVKRLSIYNWKLFGYDEYMHLSDIWAKSSNPRLKAVEITGKCGITPESFSDCWALSSSEARLTEYVVFENVCTDDQCETTNARCILKEVRENPNYPPPPYSIE